MQPLSCTQNDRAVLLVKMPRSCCFLRTTFVCLISTTRIFVLPSILLQKRFDKFSKLVKHVIAQTLACSLILSRIDYCNSVLHGAPSSAIQKLQRVQNNAAHIVQQAPRRSDVNSLLQTLCWLPVEQRINYKLAVLTFKTQQTSSLQYLNQHISLRTSARNTRSSSVQLLCLPF